MKKYIIIGFSFLVFTIQGQPKVVVKDLNVTSTLFPDTKTESNYCLNWKINTQIPATIQTHYTYEVVTDTIQNSKPYYISGWIAGSDTWRVKYNGPAFASASVYYVRVKSKTNNGETNWSNYYTLYTPLADTDTKAKWIGIRAIEKEESITAPRTTLSARYLRKEISLKNPVKRATLYYSGLGWSNAYVNGEKMGEDVLSPNMSNYYKTCYYLAKDVTAFLKKGNNTLAFVLGNARMVPQLNIYSVFNKNFGVPRLLAQLKIEYSNGKTEWIYSDETWQATNKGPIRTNNEFYGETYDANYELGEWTKSNYNATKWVSADIITSTGGTLVLQRNPPMRILEKFNAKTIQKFGDSYIVDFGQNVSGWVKIKMKGQKGDTVKMQFGELLAKNGDVYRANVSDATDVYIFGNDTFTTYHPTFTYHGFRYAKIMGLRYEPSLSDLESHFVHDGLSPTLYTSSSDCVLNKILQNCRYSLASNMKSFPIDDPCRDERGGYMGDRLQVALSDMLYFDAERFFEKWMQDIVDTRLATGEIGYTSPSFWEYYHKSVTWPGAYIDFLHNLYQMYGREDVVVAHYPYAKKWWQFMDSTYLQKGKFPIDNHGEWVPAPSTAEKDVIHTQSPERQSTKEFQGALVFYFYTKQLAKLAGIAGQKADSTYFSIFNETYKEKINSVFFDSNRLVYGNGAGLDNVLPLFFDIVPEKYKKQTVKNVIENIEITFKGVPTGLVGTKFLMRTLTNYGQIDKAYEMAVQSTYPSWGYMVANKATTVWELWNGNTAEPEMNSHNNAMMVGDLPLWFTSQVCGIVWDRANTEIPITIKPHFPKGLTFASAQYLSPSGAIGSGWQLNQTLCTWNVTVPANTMANLIINTESVNKINVLKGNIKAGDWAQTDDYTFKTTVGSGVYTFEFPVQKSISEYDFTKVSTPPKYSISDTVSSKPVLLTISAEPDAKIYYTVDGTEPTTNSTLYSKPLKIQKYISVKAMAIVSGKEPSFVNKVSVDIYNPTVNGIHIAYYEGVWKKLPDFNKEKVMYQQVIENLSIKQFTHAEDHFGAVFTGKIRIPQDGEYTFYISSDDGTKLYINHSLIIDNDGIHGPEEKFYSLKLTKGDVPFKVEYFEGDWGQNMALYISGPGISKCIIPRSFYIK